MLFSTVLLFFIVSFVAIAGEKPPDIRQVCPNLTPAVRQLLDEFYRFPEQRILQDPGKLQSGDILVFPFSRHSNEPLPYQHALDYQKHSVLVYEMKGPQDTKTLVRFEAPMRPPHKRGEFLGPEPYFVLRAKSPPSGYKDKINFFAARFHELGFHYNPLMHLDHKSAERMAEIEKLCRSNIMGESVGDFSCAEGVGTLVNLSGMSFPSGIKIMDLMEKGMEEIRALPEGKEEDAVKRVATDVVQLYSANAMEKLRRLVALRKKARTKRVLREGPDFSQEIADVERELLHFAVAREVLPIISLHLTRGRDFGAFEIDAALRRIRYPTAKGRKRLTRTERIVIRTRLSSTKGKQQLLKGEIIRPSDILNKAEKHGFEVVYFYPGHLPKMCPNPQPGGAGSEAASATPTSHQ